MRRFVQLIFLNLFISSSYAVPYKRTGAFESIKQKRQEPDSSLQKDLGYGIFEGFRNTTTGLDTWLGIPFAKPPTGSLRWQPPQPPEISRSEIIPATSEPDHCLQGGQAPFIANYGAANPIALPGGSEDCLFLNVWSPPNATNLPVFVWIHGGGYGLLSAAQYNISNMINTNDNGFVGVTIQYRLGAFGFLSSDEVNRLGTVNAGLLDQHFALQWVQSYISQFGGNASQVTIGGESAGGGSVMLQDMAYGGTQGVSLFANTIAASPYLPMQYGYADWIPSQSYYAFASAAGCFNYLPYGSNSSNVTTIFDCLVSKDTQTLQAANYRISASGRFGTWAFLPVTDGAFVQQLPSQQLLRKQLNGIRVLSGNNGEEGALFVNQDIQTESDFVAFLEYTFPLFTSSDIQKVLRYYPAPNTTDDLNALRFATEGDSGPTAINQSSDAAGQQQRANNVYAETTFVCPSYWMAEAYSGSNFDSETTAAWKYQYSIPAANHGSDLASYFPPSTPNQPPAFNEAFQRVWGNFIMHNDPSIPNAVANGANASNAQAQNPASSWPQFTIAEPYMLDLNVTGGTPQNVVVGLGIGQTANVTENLGPGLVNDFRLVDAYSWEGGRGQRCDFWRSMGVLVPE
ncbi:MAG: hypothetical protein M1820_009419 [Bogoriella megaspora]|nr:MAG: hypothetical protein M1820_009419 [Bogoriella megaspora]